MEKKIYICEFCQTAHETLGDYMTCVTKCGTEWKQKEEIEKEKKRLEKVNAALNGVKQAKKYYEEQLAKFEAEYPEEYKLNFGEKHNCSKGTCKCSDNKSKSDVKTETIELSYEDNGKDKPKMTAKVNGKDVDNKALESLLDDPDTKYIAKMLGII